MKKRRVLKKFIAMLLTLALLTSSMPVASVFAATDNLLDECEDSLEEVEESIEDSKSVITAGDWRTAIFVDKLAWNAFHNQVQRAIYDKYRNTAIEVGTELEITYGKDNDKDLIGKKGRVDIYMEGKNSILLWEVKPYSYSIEPKKSKALKQLMEYKLSRNNLEIGSNQIEGGVTHLYTQTLRGGYLEFVEYEIKYYVENNGLIFYRFERHVTKRENKEETAVDVAVKTVSSTVEGTVTGGGTGTKQESSENSSGISIKEIAAVYVMAQIMKSFHWKVYCNQEVSNSVSGAIVIECDRFQNKVKSNAAAAVIFAYISSNGTMEVDAADMESLEELQRDTNSFLTSIKDAGGTDFLIEGLEMALRGEDQEVIDEFIKLIRGEAVDYDKAFGAQPPSDPLIIDLGKKGIELCTIKDGVYFDLDCNGFAEKTAWIGEEDGFLALDRNGNGIIDNGNELFGNQVILSNGTVSSSGFEVLAELDTNSDGIIDCNDLNFYDLVVWIDANHNGRTNAGELHSLTELNISSISLNNIEKSIIDDVTGTRIANTSDVRISNGESTSTVEISEFWFPSNRTDTLHEGIATSGNVPNILKAIDRDETGTLYELVYMFNESDDIALKHYYTKQILYFITGANNVQNGSRGGNINAKDLKVIEAFMGHSFSGVSGSNPNAAAASILNEMFSNIEKQYYNILNMYASLGVYLKTVCEIEDVEGNKKLCISLLYDIIDDKIFNGENIDALIYDLGLYISLYDEANETDCFKEFYEHMAAKSKYYAFVANLSKLHNLYFGTDGNDLLYGENIAECILGADGDDTIYGGAGNDIIIGGKGNDTLSGGEGADTYVFNLGDGKDKINNYDRFNWKSDKILFGEGIKPEDIKLTRNGYDMIITNTKSEDDEITLYNAFNSDYGYYYIGSIEYADGTVWDLSKIKSSFAAIEGTENDDIINGYDSGYNYCTSEVYYGGLGNDTINGGSGNDTIYGEEGDDIIYGGTGNDTLIGETGNDTLSGGEGNDTYVFNLGDGKDKINNYDRFNWKSDKILFGEGIEPEDIKLTRNSYDMIITNRKSEGDEITLYNAFYSDYGYYFIGGIEFADKTVWDLEAIKQRTSIIEGTEGNDILNGYEGGYNYCTSEVYYGGSGNDTINGGSGNDIFIGGKGNDILNGGEGTDIYVFNLGDGKDKINNYDRFNWKSDKILFGEGIEPEDIKLTRSGYDMIIINTKSEGDEITLYNAFYSDYGYYYIGSIEYADGTVWDLSKIKSSFAAIEGTENDDIINGYDSGYNYCTSEVYYGGLGNDTINGGLGNDTIYGEEGDDTLNGGSGNDTLIGGKGNDTLSGGEGADTYIFNVGDGKDKINNYDRYNWKSDKILFGEGIEPEDIKLARKGYDIVITNRKSEGDEITLYNAFYSDYGYYYIGSIEYADGTVWDLEAIKQRTSIIEGTEENDILNGYEGGYNYCTSEVYYGGLGDDTYVFNLGDGKDKINNYDRYNWKSDKILFGEGIEPEDIKLTRKGYDMIITNIKSEGDEITLYNAFYSDYWYYFIGSIEFADKTVWNFDFIKELVNQ